MTVATQRPDSNVNSLWFTPGYENIDDAVSDPSSDGDGDSSYASPSDDNEEQQWGVEDDDLVDITQCVVHYRCQAFNDDFTITIRVRADGVWQTGQTQALVGDSGYAWFSKTFALSNAATVDAVSIQVPSLGSGDELDVTVVYLSTTGTEGEDPPAGTNFEWFVQAPDLARLRRLPLVGCFAMDPSIQNQIDPDPEPQLAVPYQVCTPMWQPYRVAAY